MHAKHKLDALLAQQAQAAVDDLLVELEVGDAVAQQAAGVLASFVNGYLVAHAVEAVGGHQTGGTGAYDRHFLAVALGNDRPYVVFLPGMLGDGGLVLAVGGGLVLDEVEHTRLLAEGWAYAARKLGEVVGGVEQLVSQSPVAFVESVVPLGRLVAQRAGAVAEGHAAVHAAARLQLAVVRVERLLHLAIVVYSIVYGPVAGLFAVYCKKCFWISHDSKC